MIQSRTVEIQKQLIRLLHNRIRGPVGTDLEDFKTRSGVPLRLLGRYANPIQHRERPLRLQNQRVRGASVVRSVGGKAFSSQRTLQ